MALTRQQARRGRQVLFHTIWAARVTTVPAQAAPPPLHQPPPPPPEDPEDPNALEDLLDVMDQVK